MMSGGRLWVEQRAALDAQETIARLNGLLDAKEQEIKSLHTVADRISTFDIRLQVLLDENRQMAGPPLMKIGWYNPKAGVSSPNRFCSEEEIEAYPDQKRIYTVPVFLKGRRE